MRKALAAVAVGPHLPLEFRELEIAEPQGPEILIRTSASGVCHTDSLMRDGHIGPAATAVPGHEGAGVVLAVGPGVDRVMVGDHVLTTQASCGTCRDCQSAHPMNCAQMERFNLSGRRANGQPSLSGGVAGTFVGQSSFCTHMLVDQSSVVVLPADFPLDEAAPLGCGLTTGAGAIFNVLRPGLGSSIAVFGAGAVGLAAVMAAAAAGCGTIVCVDLHPHRLDLARELGATHVIEGGAPDLGDRIAALERRGVDFGVDAVGLPATIKTLFEAVRPGGHVVMLGANGAGSAVPIDIVSLIFNRRIEGATLGDQIPQITIPQLIALNRAGRFPYQRLITRYPFRDVNQAIADSESGKVVKPVLTFPQEEAGI